ncbi:MAG: ATP-binding protein, partial [Leptospirales bacterium]|nr:ATP-binding protein [Leptospirales bacterium]
SPIVIKPFIKIKEQNHVLETLNKAAQEQSDEIHAGAAKLEEALNETQKASNAKSDFLANMSHEMRTPLNAIIGLSELSLSELSIDTIDTGKANKEILSNLEKIYEAGETLLSTVNDILDISKIEAGKLELVPNKYSIPSLINDTITQNILRINEKPIKFILDIDASMPTYLYGDELRIKQIFNNLLSNAFKYTKKGQVELRVNCEREGEAVWITVRVEDTGIGIRPKDIENLFTDYSQMDIKNNYKIEGTGLGLSITKKIAEMMEGFVTVESQYGKGSVFTAKIKQKFVDDSTIGEEVVNNLKNFRYSEHKRKKNSMIARKRMPYAKVLVVDDVITNLDVAKGMLKPYGMQIDCVTSGQEAVDAIRNKKVKYNAVFMDHMMPEMDGLEATKIIREEIGTEYARTVPIIALTANAIIGNEEMFLENGFQAFISKPIDVQQLDTILNTWIVSKQSKKTLLKAKKESAALYAKTVKAKQQGKLNILKDVFIEGVDIDEAMKRYNNDEIAYLNILRSYCLHTPAILKKIRGLSGNTSASSKASALSEYKIALHGLKGASYSICANIIGIEAGKLEIAAKENNNKNNFALLMTKNDSFITKVETLLYNLDKLLKKTAAGKKKKQKYHAPDSRLLSKLLDASKLYKTSTMEQIMRQLESYKYKTGNELISWLRNKMDNLNYDAIQTRLNKEINKQTNKEVKNVKKEKNHFGNRRQHIYSNHDTFNS